MEACLLVYGEDGRGNNSRPVTPDLSLKECVRTRPYESLVVERFGNGAPVSGKGRSYPTRVVEHLT